ncbi:MAG: hypothetical protein KR126chlam4_00835 [Candidatus Anoxychlamydiales bacterium]|nr:hypothetical protein [Candidatus Anoxychlamydiales bacterium]NGX41003.1 hypothetical protein [Candidatus Anoxychlamydiales bacterium]HEU64701.1 phospholipase [Chlamydiota bacterium]
MANDDNYLKSLKRLGRFVNFNSNRRVRRTLLDFLLWKLGLCNQEDEKLIVPKDFSFPKINKPYDASNPWVMWVGHCTFLIKVNNLNILTDPIWTQKCSPVSSIGPQRKLPPAIDLDQLTKVDYVVISHNHYDHLDKKTVINLNKKFPNIKWIVPLGMKRWMKKIKVVNITELDWWENFEDGFIEIYATPAQHYSGRSLLDGNKVLWVGYVIVSKNDQKKLYFTGDTGYNEIDFKQIGKKFKFMDLSLIPIGTYVPRKFMNPVHIDPQDAVKIHKDVNSNFSVAMHWKIFNLSDEAMLQPPYELYLSLQKENIDLSKFRVLDPGSYVNW